MLLLLAVIVLLVNFTLSLYGVLFIIQAVAPSHTYSIHKVAESQTEEASKVAVPVTTNNARRADKILVRRIIKAGVACDVDWGEHAR